MHVTGDAEVAPEAAAVRLPLQLTPTVHRRLADWCRETARLLDTSGVARGDVIEALIDQLISDPRTSEAVRARLSELTSYQPSPAPAGVPVTHIGHHRSSAGRPTRLGAMLARDESARVDQSTPVETLGA